MKNTFNKISLFSSLSLSSILLLTYSISFLIPIYDSIHNTKSFNYSNSSTHINFDKNLFTSCIEGTIQKACNMPIEGVKVYINGDVTDSVYTDANGYYKFNNIPTGSNVVIRPSKPTGCQGDTCINILDKILIEQHILGQNTFSNPYQYIAADVNKSGTVTSFDNIRLQQLITGVPNAYQGNDCFRFIDANYTFMTNNPPAESFPEMININGITGTVQADFIAVQLGNVSDCCEQLMPSFLELSLDTLMEDCNLINGSTWSIPIRVKNFNNIYGLQFTLNWNAINLQYAGISNHNLSNISSGNFGTTNTNNGTISFVWSAQNPITLSDGTAIFHLELIVTNPINSIVFFDSDPTYELVVNQALESSSPITQNGYLGINSTNCPPCVGLSLGNHNICKGDQICLDVSTSNFTDIVSMQYSITWDTNIIQFQQTQAYNLTGLVPSNFLLTNNKLSVAWFDHTAAGVTLPNGASIYEICFTAVRDGVTSIDFINTPTPIEFADDNNAICHNLSNSQIEVGKNPTCSGCDTTYLTPQIIPIDNCIKFARPPLDTFCERLCQDFWETPYNSQNECLITCDSSTQLYKAVLHAGNTYHWKVEGGTIIGANNLDSVLIEWRSIMPASITLIETDHNGCMDSTSICIEFIDSPSANFNYTPTSPCLNTPIYFNDLSINANAWHWDFGDGTTSNLQHPNHSFSTGGLHTVTLIISNITETAQPPEDEMYCECITQCACSDTLSIDILIDPLPGPPILCIGTACVGDEVCYKTPSACSSASYNWTVDPLQGMIVDGGNSTDTFICVQWLAGSEGMLTLDVSACSPTPYCPSPTIVKVPIIDPNLPIINGDTTACVLDKYNYYVPKFSGATYNWSVIGGVIRANAPYTNEIPIQWYSSNTGQIIVEVIHDKRGCSTIDTLNVRISNNINLAETDIVCENEQTSYFISTPFTWNVTGGTITSANPTNHVSILWDVSAGFYEVTAIPTDFSLYCDSIATMIVEVIGAPTPPILTTGPTVICPNGSYEYIASASQQIGDIEWWIEGGTATPSTGNNVIINWDPTGPYLIKLLQKSNTDPICISDTTFIPVNTLNSINATGITTTCTNSTSSYSATVNPTGTLPIGELFNWSIIPSTAGSIIAGQGMNTINVQWKNDPISAKVAVNYCNNSISDTVYVSLSGIAAPINGPTILCSNDLGLVTVTGDFSNNAKLTCVDDPSMVYFPTGSNINPSFNVPGGCCYLFEGEDSQGCVATNNICIGKDGPEGIINPLSGLGICSGANIHLMLGANTGNGYTYQWEQNCNGSWTTLIGETNAILDLANFSSICQFRCLVTEAGCTVISNILETTPELCLPDTCIRQAYTLDFTFSDCDPTVNFIQTTSNVNNLSWDFGDGGGSVSVNPSHTYTDVGCFIACLSGTVPDQNGNINCEVEVCKTINIPMILDWTHSLVNCGAGIPEYQFNDLSQFSPKIVDVDYNWSFVDGCTNTIINSMDPNPNPLICGDCNNTIPVNLQVTTTDTDGTICTDSYSKNINLSGSTPNALIPSNICIGDKVTFIDQSCGAVEWLWNFGDGATSTLQNPCRTYTTSGLHNVTLTTTDSYGCTSSTTFSQNIMINPLPTVNVTLSTDPNAAEVCEGNTITLTASPGGYDKYEWFDATNNMSLPNGSSNIFVANTTGVYFVEVTDHNDCKIQSEAISIIIHDFPNIKIEGNTEICHPEPLNLIAPSGDYTYEWRAQGNSTILSSNMTLNQSSLPAQNYVYELTLLQNTAPNCSKVFSIPVTVNPEIIMPYISVNTYPSCVGNDVTLSISNYNPNLDYQWSNGMTGNPITIFSAQEGAINVTAIDPNTGCNSTSTSEHIFPLPDVCVVPSGCYEACPFDTICINAPSGTYFQWLQNGAIMPGQNTNCLIIETSGAYQAILTSLYGCKDTSDIIDYTIIDCDTTCCQETNSLIANGGFNGYANGNIPVGSSPWSPIHATPRISNNDGCDSLGCLQIWGNEVVGETVEQSGITIQAGNTYKLSFCARYVNSHPQAPLWAQVEIRASDASLPFMGCIGNCEVIYTTPQMNTLDWQQFCFDWTPQNDYDRITIRTINGETLDHGDYVSRVRLDDVCLELINAVPSSSCDTICYENPSWDVLNSGQFHHIFDMVEYQGTLYVAGEFTPSGILKWDGNNLIAVAGSPNGDIYSLEVHNGILYAGGTIANGLASFDGNAWNLAPTPAISNSNGPSLVKALLSTPHGLIVGGQFDSPTNNIAIWQDGNSTWNTGISNPGGSVSTFGLLNSDLVVGGNFSIVGNNIARWQFSNNNWLSLGNGLSNVNANITEKGVSCIEQIGNYLYVGGLFSDADNIPNTEGFARWNILTNSWEAVGGGIDDTNVPASVNTCKRIGNDLIIAGRFNQVGGQLISSPARWNIINNQWYALGNSAGLLHRAIGCLSSSSEFCDIFIGGEAPFEQYSPNCDSTCTSIVSCPSDTIIRLTPNENSIIIDYPPPIVLEDCEGHFITCHPPSGSEFFCGTTPVFCFIYDSLTMNWDTCFFNVIIDCSNACQVDFDWSLDANNCLKVNFDTINIFGASPINFLWAFPDNTSSTLTNPMWTAPDTGIYEICLEMTDSIGCKDTICQNISVYDHLSPSIICPLDTNIFIPACDREIVVDYIFPIINDNCGVDSAWCNYGIGTLFECGNTLVTCYARDIYGNIDSCSFNVNVICECAKIVEQTIMCGDSATGYDFCIYLEKTNGANNGNCTINVTTNQNDINVNVDNIHWIHPDTAKITGTIGSIRPIPTQLNLLVDLQCSCPDSQPSNCTLPVNFLTPCCDSIFIKGKEVCGNDPTLYLSLDGSIDFENIAQTVWYVSQGACPNAPFGGTPYQSSTGYADLLLLPNYYTTDALCVYAEVIMRNGPCNILTTNLDSIEICNPITCSLKDTAYCYTGSPITPAPLCLNLDLNNQNCEYFVIWLDENGDTIHGENGLKYQPPAIDFIGAIDACSYEVNYTAIVNSACGNTRCAANIRLDNNNAATGQLTLDYPNTNMPFCPGQDATISYTPACVGEPPIWNWHQSLDGTNFTSILTAGTQNPTYNTNRLFNTTWFMVTKQNGNCMTPDSTIIKIEVKDSLKIANFTTLPLDICRTTGVIMNVGFNPCSSGTGNSCDCDYNIKWYKDGQLIHSDNYNNSPATFYYIDATLNGDYSGNYYAVVSDNCCDQAQKTVINSIAPPIEVLATGPCSQCFNETVTLEGLVINAIGNCNYQWFQVNGTIETPIPGGNTQNIQVNQPGTYIFEANCDGCITRSTFILNQCNDLCQLDDIAPTAICVSSIALPISSNGQIELFPTDIDDGSFDNCMIDYMFLDKYIFDCNDIGQNTITLTVVDALGNQNSCSTIIDIQDNSNNCANFCIIDTIELGPPTLTGIQHFAAKKVIITESTLASGSDIIMQAKNKIDFKTGFHVLPGAKLTARIEDCNPPILNKADIEALSTKTIIAKKLINSEGTTLKIQTNPFIHSTTIILELPAPQITNLIVFDQSGKVVLELLNDVNLLAGRHEIPMIANQLNGGVYYVNLLTPTSNIIKKVILISDSRNGKEDDD